MVHKTTWLIIIATIEILLVFAPFDRNGAVSIRGVTKHIDKNGIIAEKIFLILCIWKVFSRTEF